MASRGAVWLRDSKGICWAPFLKLCQLLSFRNFALHLLFSCLRLLGLALLWHPFIDSICNILTVELQCARLA